MSNIYILQVGNDYQFISSFVYSTYEGIKRNNWSKNKKEECFQLIELRDIFSFRGNKNIDKYIPVGSVEFINEWSKRFYDKELIFQEPFENFYLKHLGFELKEISNINTFPSFIKPYKNLKLFSGDILEKKEDIDSLISLNPKIKKNEIIYCKKPFFEIAAEFRIFCFSRLEYIIQSYFFDDAYKIDIPKDLALHRDFEIGKYPFSYDVCVLSNREVHIIDIHDGWALGDYGIDPSRYKNFTKLSWEKIIRGIKNEA